MLWNPATRTARIVEVKGPNDRLSTKQMLWIRYLLDHGAEAEVCYVRALGRRGAAKKQREGKNKNAAASPKKRRRTAAAAGVAADEAGNDAGGDKGDGAQKTDGGDGKVMKRKRGRPRKVREGADAEDKTSGGAAAEASSSGRAGRGRLRKQQIKETGEDGMPADQVEADRRGTPTGGKSAEGPSGQRGRKLGDQEKEEEAVASGGAKRTRTETSGEARHPRGKAEEEEGERRG